MKSIALFLCLLSTQLFAAADYLSAQVPKQQVNAGTIPAAFSTSDVNSRYFPNTNVPTVSGFGHLDIFNGCTTGNDVIVNVNYGPSTVPPANDPGNIYVPAGMGVIRDDLPIQSAVYVKGATGTVSGCSVRVTIW